MASATPVDRNRPRNKEETEMKSTAPIFAMLLFFTVNVCAQDSVQKTQERAAKAKPSDCAKVCFEAARQLIEASNQLYSGGDVQQGLKLMNDAVAYSKK